MYWFMVSVMCSHGVYWFMVSVMVGSWCVWVYSVCNGVGMVCMVLW